MWRKAKIRTFFRLFEFRETYKIYFARAKKHESGKANVTGSRDVRDTNGALSFAIVLRARITSFPADRNPRKFIERLDPRFSILLFLSDQF